eukprot:scaffold163377_cov19-Tisochrysis_lutea.AAC.1
MSSRLLLGRLLLQHDFWLRDDPFCTVWSACALSQQQATDILAGCFLCAAIKTDIPLIHCDIADTGTFPGLTGRVPADKLPWIVWSSAHKLQLQEGSSSLSLQPPLQILIARLGRVQLSALRAHPPGRFPN